MNNVRKMGYVLTMAVALLALQSIASAECCECDCEECCTCCCDCQPGCGTPGYWMNHPEAWPDWPRSEIVIGTTLLIQDEAMEEMKMPVKGDKRFSLFSALVAAKLNVAVGNCDCCVADAIEAANTWMADHEGGSVKASSPEWQEIAGVFTWLDAYNNGCLCAPARDAVEYDD